MSTGFTSGTQNYFQGIAPDAPGRSIALRRFGHLLLPRILKEASDKVIASVDIEARDAAHAAFMDWRAKLASPKFTGLNESNLEQAFNAQCLGALGYKSVDKVAAGQPYTLAPKHSLSSGIADVVLGHFRSADQITPNIRVVVELKGPGTRLDRASSGNRSPIQQAFDYLSQIDGTDLWAIVSNMSQFFLFAKSRSASRCVWFDLDQLANPKEFGRFYAAFNARNLIGEASAYDSTLSMLQRSEQKQQKVGKDLYQEYRTRRFELIETIRRDSLCQSFDDALAAAQLLLDRILFIAFAEDRGLLESSNHIETTAATRVVGLSPWRAFQNLFRAIDQGDPDFKIPAFNGSLFKPHPIIDHPQFSLPTVPWNEVFRTIGGYDFADEVNVTVLGHIFEQSITDIEALRQRSQSPAEPESAPAATLSADPPAKSRKSAKSATDSARKTHGVYYTDDSVTEYLVAAALDPVWADAESAARQIHPLPAKPARPQLEANLRARLAALDSLTLCDPACGSGAFLVAGLKWFIQHRVKLLEELFEINPDAPEFELTRQSDESLPWNEFDRTPATVLKNNIFGVDLSTESVEISRLSLWLYTARKGQKLTDLSRNIQQGNSVVADPAALPAHQHHLAFNWQDRFPVIFASRGGFDVVVGNPPYVRQETLGPDFKNYVKDHFEAYHGMADLYVYFYERGLGILRPGGQLAYIVTNKWMKAGYGEPLRRLFAEKAWVRSVMDFGHAKQFFADADVFPCFLILQKPVAAQPPPAETMVAVLNRDEVEIKKLDEQIQSVTILVPRSRFGSDSWSLESPKVNELIEKIRRNGIPLSEYAGVKPVRGIITGFNEAFLIDGDVKDSLIKQDAKAAEILKPYYRGQDVKRWKAEWANLWMICTRRGININEYPSIKQHLEKYRDQLEPKPKNYSGNNWKGRAAGNYEWYELQAPVIEWFENKSPKILYQEIQFHSSYAYDSDGFLCIGKCFGLFTTDLSILGILNSPLMWWHNWRYLPHMKDDALTPAGFLFENVPLPLIKEKPKKELISQTDKILELKRVLNTNQASIVDWISVEFGITKLTNKLQSPETLNSDDFISEIKKVIPKEKPLTPLGLRSLREVYNSTIEPQRQIALEILNLERSIAKIVHEAYGLTAEDLDLMQKTAPPRMPYFNG